MVRQLAIWAAVLFAIALIAAAIAPSQHTKPAPVFPAPSASGAPARAAIDAILPSTTPLIVDAGEIVRLRIASGKDAEVEVSGLGVRAPVGPGTTGLVEFVADSPGSWPVLVDPTGTRIGTVEVQG